MAAAGWAKTVAHVKALAKIPHLTHIVIGSYTVPQRDGNTGGTNFEEVEPGVFVNALGLPNGGIAYVRTYGREMSWIAHDAGKLLVVSGAWFKPEESGQLAEAAFEIGADVYESNDGCPNVFDGGKQKDIPSYNLELMTEGDEYLFRAVGASPVWKKLSPIINPLERVAMANYLCATPIQRVTVVNTIPNFRAVDPNGNNLVTAKNTNGLAGLSGKRAIKWVGLANAQHYRELLPDSIGVNGVGGIESGGDLEDYRLAGCTGMQVGAACFWRDNIKALADIANEWANSYAETA